MSIEQDKELAKLYLARSEGKIIQIPAVSTKDGSCWIELNKDYTIGAQCRIKPQTVEEAALDYIKDIETPECYGIKDGFVKGAQWQKDQSND